MDTVTMTELEGIARLAAKARQEGVRLYRDRQDGRHYASSATTPGKHYYVTLASCTCPGFLHHQRCKHWAALHIATILQDGHDPTPPAIACPQCSGVGTVASPRSRWVGGSKLGYRSEWTVLVDCPVCHPADIAA